MKNTIQELEERIKEIKSMSNEYLLGALRSQAGYCAQARRDMRTQLADNLYKDIELLTLEALGRMHRPARGYHDVTKYYEDLGIEQDLLSDSKKKETRD